MANLAPQQTYGFGVPTFGTYKYRGEMPSDYAKKMLGAKGDPLADVAAGKPVEGLKSPLPQRMSKAYDKLLVSAEEKASALTPQSIRTLGKLVLEFEQVNSNLGVMQKELKNQFRQKTLVAKQEKKLAEDEVKELRGIKGMFFDFRSKLALFSGALGIKALMEGRYGDAAQYAAITVGSMIPEIINTVAGGAMLLLGAKGVAGGGKAAPGGAGRVRLPRGGGRLGVGLGLAGVGLGAYSLMRPSDTAQELQVIKQREIGSNTSIMSVADVNRFKSILGKFEKILDKLLSNRGEDKTGRVSTGTGGTTPPSPQPTDPRSTMLARGKRMAEINEASKLSGVPASEISAMMEIESGFNPGSTSGSGAQGLMQIMPGTYNDLYRKHGKKFGLVNDPYDPRTSAILGAMYMRELYNQGFTIKNIGEAYNAGPRGAGKGYKEAINHQKKFLNALPKYQKLEIQPKQQPLNILTPSTTTTNSPFDLKGFGSGMFMPIGLPQLQSKVPSPPAAQAVASRSIFLDPNSYSSGTFEVRITYGGIG